MKYGSFQVIRLDEVCPYTQTIPKLCTINVLQWRLQVLKKEESHLYDFFSSKFTTGLQGAITIIMSIVKSVH